MRMVHFNKSTLISNGRKCEVMAGTETKGPDISIILILQRKCQIWSRTSWPGHTSLFDLSFIENSLREERNAWINLLDKQSNCLCWQTCRWRASSWSRSTSRRCGSCAWRAWRTCSSCSTSPPTSSYTAQSPSSSRSRSPRSAGSSARRPQPHREVGSEHHQTSLTCLIGDGSALIMLMCPPNLWSQKDQINVITFISLRRQNQTLRKTACWFWQMNGIIYYSW